VKLGDQARQQGHIDEAIGYYDKAVAAVGDRPETAVALLYLGTAIYGKDPSKRSTILSGLRMSRHPACRRTGDGLAGHGQAAPGRRSASRRIALSGRAGCGGGELAGCGLTMEFLAHFLREQGRISEAEAMEASAGEIRKAHVAHLSPKPTATAQASKVGNGVAAPALLHKLEPDYSVEARAAKVQGTVVLSVVIGTDGRASDVQLRKGVGYGLDEQALDAITQWTFKPGMRDGMAVPVQASIEVNFRLL